MKFFYRQTECNFREFMSAYLASTMGYARDRDAMSLALSLIAQHIAGQTLTETQRAQIVRDTNGQCMVELSFDEFMTVQEPTVLLGMDGAPATTRPNAASFAVKGNRFGNVTDDEAREMIAERETNAQRLQTCREVHAANLNRPAFQVPIRAEYGNKHKEGGMCVLVGADNETIGELWSAKRAEVDLLVQRVNRGG